MTTTPLMRDIQTMTMAGENGLSGTHTHTHTHKHTHTHSLSLTQIHTFHKSVSSLVTVESHKQIAPKSCKLQHGTHVTVSFLRAPFSAPFIHTFLFLVHPAIYLLLQLIG
jgi:hypothetical protein